MRFPSACVTTAVAVALSTVALLTGPAGADGATVAAPDRGRPVLPAPVRGPEAIRLLGDRLDELAGDNGWTPSRLRTVLSTDSTAWVDQRGRLFYQDRAPIPATSGDGQAATASPPVPLSETFELHSKPDSNHTLYIDFDGADVSGTAWNTGHGVPDGNYPAWSLDRDPGTFNDAERAAIQVVWQQVAEDYAPFDLDVTTQDPGEQALARTDPSDQFYGVRALVTPSEVAEGAICGTPVPSCGGAAYTGVFGEADASGSHQPAWIFPQSLGPNDIKNVGETVSHEVGHTFGLQHHGRVTPSEGYYSGHAMWAPIMGEGYRRPVTQWSSGEYTGADNTGQDDVAVIAARVPLRADEAGSTVATAASSVPVTGYVTDRADADTFALGTCGGTVTVQATGAASSPDLDLRLELLDTAGLVVASADPPSAFVSRTSASGLAASLSQRVATGTYYARVDGVGIGTGATGYTDYASIGSYHLEVFGCGATMGVPAPPTALEVTPASDGRSATATWSAPADSGSSPLSGYTVTRSGGAPVHLGVVGTYSWTGLTPGTPYTFTVAARNAAGSGAPASQEVETPSARRPPGAPRIKKVVSGRPGGMRTALVTWTPPADGGGLPLTGYRVEVLTADGRLVTTIPIAPRTTRLTLKVHRRERYRVVVIAQNRAGAGVPSAASRLVRAR